MKENSIEKDEEILNNIKAYMQENIDKGYHKFVYNDLGYDEKCADVINAIEHILSDYKKLQEEFKQVDHECERLEEKEVKLIKENEELKEDLKYVLNQTLGAFEKNWCIDWNFTEIREKYNLESEE